LLLINIATLTIEGVTKSLSSFIDGISSTITNSSGKQTVYGKSKNKIINLQKTINSKSNQIFELKNKVKSINTVNYKGQTKPVKKVVQETYERISKRVALDASRNIASLPAEAVPYLGISVIATITAWELYDACETMKDLHELNSALNPLSTVQNYQRVCSIKVPSSDEISQKIKYTTSETWEVATEKIRLMGNKTEYIIPTWQDIKVKYQEFLND